MHQISQPQQSGKRRVKILMKEFQAQCEEKVNERTVDFGPRQLETGCYGKRVVIQPYYGVWIDAR